MPTPPELLSTWRNLHLAERAVRRILDERLRTEAGCSLLEHDLLAWLTAAPGRRLQMLDLAGRLDVTRGGLTHIVDRLVDRGWIERDRPPHNRREVHAVLTADGRRAMVRARAVYRRALTRGLGDHLTRTEQSQLARITDKLRTALAAADPC
jgi:DNA-binding MarR family transcriptional regulator